MSDENFQLSRRALLGSATVGTLGALVAGAAGPEVAAGVSPLRHGGTIPFFASHQSGIATPPQLHLALATFDLTDGASRSEIASMLNDWTAASAAMTKGQPAPGPTTPQAAPSDPGQALDLGPSGLTVTLGVGRDFLAHPSVGGTPALIAQLPSFAGDQLDPVRSGGGLCIQACAQDPQVAFHAVHVLTRLGSGTTTLRSLQRGFLPDSAKGGAPRNLMGFKDGSRNLNVDDPSQMNHSVWTKGASLPRWMQGGTFMVARRIRIRMERWAESPLIEQEQTVGRRRDSGAPLSGQAERDRPDFAALDTQGSPVIPLTAHLRLASPEANDGIRILRRGYSFSDGIDPATGELDAGIMFLAFMADPLRQFVPLQQKLVAKDALHDYLVHTASSVFAIPQGLQAGQSWGSQLLA